MQRRLTAAVASLAAAAAVLCVVAVGRGATSRSTELADVRALRPALLCGPSCRRAAVFLTAVVDALACSWRGLRVLCADARRLQVAVASNAFPSYYGGSSSHPKVFTRYPTSQASGVQSLAAAGQQGVQSLYSGCGDSV